MGINALLQARTWAWVSSFLFSLLLTFPITASATDSWRFSSPDRSRILLAQGRQAPSPEPAPSEAPPPAPRSSEAPTEQPAAQTTQDQPPADEKLAAPADEKEAAPADEGAADEEEEVAPARIPLVGVQQGGVLLQRDQLVLEPTLAYSYGTNTRLILSGFSVLPLIILGTLESEKVTTQTFSPSFGFRYGIRRGMQIDFRIPFILQSVTRLRVQSEAAGQVEEGGESSGIGDVSFGFSYQFLYERAWIPDMVFRIGASAPTGRSQFDIFDDIINAGEFGSLDQFQNALISRGPALGSGRWSIDSTISGVKALDPAILFGTLGFSYSPEVTETLLTLTGRPSGGGIQIDVEPTQSTLGATSSISASLGMAISLNNQLSMNWSFANLYRFSTTANGQNIPDSQLEVASFNMGFNIAVTPRITTNIVGTIGITPDAPDFSFSMTVPFSVTNAIGRTITWLKEVRPWRSAPPPLPEDGEEEVPVEEKPTKGESIQEKTSEPPPEQEPAK